MANLPIPRSDDLTKEAGKPMNARHLLFAASMVGASALAGSGIASAHPVGDDSEPNCHGQRVSHGASHSEVHGGHGLTPVERRDLLVEFGVIPEGTNLGEWNQFIKTCPPPEEPPI
jgi:hypothetical protein